MTRLSLPMVHKCPACAGYLTRISVTFFHMDGMRGWSDGCTAGIWNGLSGPVVRCPHCTAVFWLDDVESIGELPYEPRPIGRISQLLMRLSGDRSGRLRKLEEWRAIPAEIKEAPPATKLDYQGLCDALRQTNIDVDDREAYIRRQIWWLSNDHQRLRGDGTPVVDRPVVPGNEAIVNMHRLVELLKDDEASKVERGELLRQLWCFDEAIAVLKTVRPDGYSEVRASKIQRWAQERNAALQVLAA